MAAKVSVGGRTYVERKAQIAYVSHTGRVIVTGRWLSQIDLFASRVLASGGSDFRWRLHARAPWHRVEDNH